MSLPVAIIICCYENDRRFLPKALESAVAQGVREIILVDDGSQHFVPADVRDYVRAYNITLIHKSRNAGLSAARNTGIRLSTAEFLLPLDADDWLYPKAVDALVRVIGDADIASGNITEVPEGQLTTDALWVRPPLADHCSGLGLTSSSWRAENQCFATSLFRRKVWEAVGGYTEQPSPHYEDYRMWCAAFTKGFRFRHVDALVYNHTPRADSMLQKLHGETQKWHDHAIRGLDLE
jgi:GT2 family glycosyltransferase